MFLKEDDMSEELLRVIGLVAAAVAASGCALFALRVVLRRNTSAFKITPAGRVLAHVNARLLDRSLPELPLNC